MKKILSFFLFGLLAVLLNCSEEELTESINQPPNIQSVTANPSSIKVNEITKLTCIATDTNGDNLTYSWSADEGDFVNGTLGSSVIWRSPSSSGNYDIVVIVNDGKKIAESKIYINIEELSTKISGKVFDRETKEPIMGVRVSVENRVDYTDENGYYQFLDFVHGTYEITVEKENYFVYTGQVILTSSEIIFDVTIDYIFGDIFGTVKDSYTGEILKNIKVNINGMEQVTDQNGYYNFLGLVKGAYTITADDESYKYPLYSEHILLANKNQNYNISLLNVCAENTTVTYAGKIYNTVQIENQCWLRENLDVGTMITSYSQNDRQTDNGTIEKFCYGNDGSNCDAYGGLYQWSEAMQYQRTEGSQGICPTDWHIPAYAELITLRDAVGKKSSILKAIGQGIGTGAGTNKSGFTALLAGYHYNDPTHFNHLGVRFFFWSSTEFDINFPNLMFLVNDDDYVHFDVKSINNGYSIRCLKD